MKILRNILFYLLFILTGFFLGILLAGIVDAGKGQMLAGGAIVFGYGVVGAILGLIVSIILTTVFKVKPSMVVLLNKILVILLLGLWVFFYLKYQKREAQKNDKIGCVWDITKINLNKENLDMLPKNS